MVVTSDDMMEWEMIFLKEQLNIAELIDMLLRKWWILAISAVILSVGAFFYAQVMVEPLYKTDGSMYVNAQRTQTSDVSQNALMASQRLAVTYKEILTRRTFLSRVAEDLGNRYTVSQIEKMISISPRNDTEIMEIQVTGEVPEDVYLICHSVLTHAADELVRVVNAGSVKILDDAQIPETPFAPNVKNYTLIAFLVGLVIGALIVLCTEMFDTRIKSRDDIVNKYDEPLLGEIPELSIPVVKAGEDK